MLTKTNSLPICVAAFGWTIHASLKSVTRIPVSTESGVSARAKIEVLRNSSIVLVVAILICGPWLVRNTILYGEPLAIRVFEEAFRNSMPRPSHFLAAGIDIFTYLRALLTIFFCTIWGVYGGPNTALSLLRPFGTGPLPAALTSLPLLLACMAASLAAVLGLVRVSPWRDTDGKTRRVLVWWGIATALIFVAWGNLNLIQFQGQARLVNPALLPLAIFAAHGWRTLFGNSRAGAFATAGFALVLLALTFLNAFGWRTLV
jgi:hypothetical protein